MESFTFCENCMSIFEGRWMEKERWDLARVTSSQLDADAASFSDEASLKASSFDENEWRPGWVKVVQGTPENTPLLDLDASSLSWPQHHTTVDLERSASSGCPLCTALVDIVRGKLLEWGLLATDLISRVVVQPDTDSTVPENSLAFEVSYFDVQQEVTESAYRFSASILMLPYQSPYQINLSQVEAHPPLTESSSLPVRQSTLDQISAWISDCSHNHQDCQMRIESSTNKDGKLPARLLYIEPSVGHPLLRIVETAEVKTGTKYASLSHCWGKSPIIRLLRDQYERFREEVKYETLSKTFQDAVLFTAALGLQYLWIDSLCIIQDSEEDWAREASRMCSVYSNSWVTFAATSSTDGAGGLFHPPHTGLTKPCVIQSTWTGHKAGQYLLVDQSAWERRVHFAPLNKRGWVLQERLLAPRTIHCAYDQLWWSCADTDPCCNETFPCGVPAQREISRVTDPLTLMRLFAEQRDMASCNDLWLGILTEYTQRELTYISDKLIALSGVAEAAMSLIGLSGDSYFAGFWKPYLMVDLLWRVATTGNRPDNYVAPSWTWASVDGEVYFCSPPTQEVAKKNSCATLLEAKVAPVNGLLGPVKNGHLVVQSPLLRVKLSALVMMSSGSYSLNHLHFGGSVYEAGSGFEEALDHTPMYVDWPDEGQHLYFACFMTTFEHQNSEEYMSDGLILERTGDASGEYRRVGWLRVFHSLPGNAFFAEVANKQALATEDYLQHDGVHIYTYRII